MRNKLLLVLGLLLLFTYLPTEAQTGIFGAQWPIWQNSTVTPLAGDASLSWARMHPALHWWEIEPTRDVPYAWPSGYTGYINDVTAEGITPIVTLQGTPNWAKDYSGSWHCGPIKEIYLSDYVDFVTAAVNKYKVLGVKYWEIWNEPDAASNANVYGCWATASSDPNALRNSGKAYAKFLAAAYDAVKAADPTAKVICGGLMLSLSGDASGTGSTSLDFFEGVLQYLQANGKQGFDIAAYHSYASWYGWGVDWDTTSADCGTESRVLCRYGQLKDLLNQYGRNPPIMMNEGGMNCSPSFQTICNANLATYTAAKANHLVRTTTRAMSVDILSYSWYMLNDPGWRMSGLLGPGQTPSPPYNALKKFAPMLSGATFQGKFGTGKNYEGHLFRKGSKDYRVYWTANGSTTDTEVIPSGTTRYVKMAGDGNMHDLGIPANATIDFMPLVTESANANIDMQAQSTYILSGKLHQAFWRGNYGFARTVPISGGAIQWDLANPWSAAIPASALPGSGDMQAQSTYILGGHLYQAFWRGNQGYYRQVPIVGGAPDWGSAPPFSGPIPASALPGSGNMQAQSTYILNGKLHQAFWRGNQGYYRQVPIVGGAPDWGSAPPFNGPIPASAVPGSGNMQAQSTYTLSTKFHQAFWRGNQGFYRSVPIVGGSPNWAAASGFGGPIAASALPLGPS